jgi:maltose O-acetyltransferase
MNYINFLKEKIKGYSFGLIIRLELESFFFFLFSLIPTTFGVIFRAILVKVFFKKCKGFSWIQPRVTIVHSQRLKVGTNFVINSGTYINAVGKIEIGSYVIIGNNVTISSGKHPIEGSHPPIVSRQTIPQKIIIEDDVWIGAGVVIMPGIKLSKGTVVGANSIVTKDTNEYDIVVGSPATFLKKRV